MRTIKSNRAFSAPNHFFAGRITITELGDKLTVTNDVIGSNLICEGYEVMNERTKEFMFLTVNQFGALSL